MTDSPAGLAFVAASADKRGTIHSYTANAEKKGSLKRLRKTPAGEEPSYLAIHPEKQVLYAVENANGGTVRTFDIDPQTGSLSQTGVQATGSEGPCYCSIDRKGEYLLAAHYQGGSVSALPIDIDGTVKDPSHVVDHDGDTPHPHAIVPHPSCERIYVPNLGIDAVVEYELDRDAGHLNQIGATSVRDGAGPRHFVFHPDQHIVYVVNERDSTLTSFDCGPAGELNSVETVDTIPDKFEGDNYPADIHVHPDGQYVYVSNRGHDSIGIFGTDEKGQLEYLGTESTRGEWPRDFAIAPDGQCLYVENKNSDSVVQFSVNETTGELTQINAGVEVPTPSCMKFFATAGNPIT